MWVGSTVSERSREPRPVPLQLTGFLQTQAWLSSCPARPGLRAARPGPGPRRVFACPLSSPSRKTLEGPPLASHLPVAGSAGLPGAANQGTLRRVSGGTPGHLGGVAAVLLCPACGPGVKGCLPVLEVQQCPVKSGEPEARRDTVQPRGAWQGEPQGLPACAPVIQVLLCLCSQTQCQAAALACRGTLEVLLELGRGGGAEGTGRPGREPHSPRRQRRACERPAGAGTEGSLPLNPLGTRAEEGGGGEVPRERWWRWSVHPADRHSPHTLQAPTHCARALTPHAHVVATPNPESKRPLAGGPSPLEGDRTREAAMPQVPLGVGSCPPHQADHPGPSPGTPGSRGRGPQRAPDVAVTSAGRVCQASSGQGACQLNPPGSSAKPGLFWAAAARLCREPAGGFRLVGWDPRAHPLPLQCPHAKLCPFPGGRELPPPPPMARGGLSARLRPISGLARAGNRQGQPGSLGPRTSGGLWTQGILRATESSRAWPCKVRLS